MSEPSRTLPAQIALPPDAGSFALAVDGAAYCPATSGPEVVSVPRQLLSGVKSQSGVVQPTGGVHPLKISLPALVWFFFTVALSLLPALLCSDLEFIHFWFLGSLRRETKDDIQKNLSSSTAVVIPATCRNPGLSC